MSMFRSHETAPMSICVQMIKIEPASLLERGYCTTATTDPVNMARRKLAACLLNVSEGRSQTLVRDIAAAAVKNQAIWAPDSSFLSESIALSEGTEWKDDANTSFNCNATVLNIFQDREYNRSVITLAAPVEYLGDCILDACDEAFSRIDLRDQDGGHPRLGAVDLIPIHPLSDAASLKVCGKIARKVGLSIVDRNPSTSVFFFGDADIPEKRGLVTRRKEMKWYDGKKGHVPSLWDIGCKPTEKFGLTAVGAIPYMTNFNVTIDSRNLDVGNQIAKKIRGSSPDGLFGVQSMAFPHMGMIEIACNVETLDLQQVKSYTGRQYSSFDEIREKIKQLCDEEGISVYGSEILGLTPEQAYQKTMNSLLKGVSFDPTTFDDRRM